MPSLLPLDAQEAWAARQRKSMAMGPSRKLELEAQLKRQKALLSQVKSGALKLPDGGEKIRVRIQELEGALAQLVSTQPAIKSLHRERGVQDMDTGQKQVVHSASGPSIQNSECQMQQTEGLEKHMDTQLLRETSDRATTAGQEDTDNDVNGNTNSREIGLRNSSSAQQSNRKQHTGPKDSGPEAPSISNSDTSADSRQASTREELTRRSEGTPPSVRQISGVGKSVRLRSGSLEPMNTGLPSEVVRETAEKVRAQMTAEVDATAEKLGQMLTIEEDGSPMDVGPSDGPLTGVRDRKYAGRSGSVPHQRSSPRATKFISMQEAAELERRQAEAQREVEDRILSRRPPLYAGPGMMDMREEDAELTDESEHDMFGSEKD